MKIFNNLIRQKVDFTPLEEGKVKFYSCGPTTYNFLHVGNARALVVGDLIHRAFKALDYDVTFVRNYTDVDDKIIDEAHKLKEDPLKLSARFVEECETDMKSLGMLPATHTPKVSETMKEIIVMIEDLIKNEAAYVVDGEVLYHVPHFHDYGKLSKKKLEDLEHGIRVEVDQKKKHPSDFVLWKPAKEGEPAWDSPWGKGRPGWHIECSAMAKKFLGKTIDLHHGGVDLMFPHHENEIAQSESANLCDFAHYWVHHEFVNFSAEKMSKSLGNVVTIRDFTKRYSGQILRHMFLSVHYRSKMEWNDEAIENAIHEVERLHEFASEVEDLQDKVTEIKQTHPEISSYIYKIKDHLENDFNTTGAMAEVFNFIRFVRRDIFSKDEISQVAYNKIKDVITFAQEALGCFQENPKKTLEDLQSMRRKVGRSNLSEKDILNLIKERQQAKANKNFAQADFIRDELKEMGITLKDRPDGSTNWSYE